MRRHTIAVLLLLFSFPAGAQSAAIPATVDYAWGFPIRTQATASFYAVELPIEVNRSVTDLTCVTRASTTATANPCRI